MDTQQQTPSPGIQTGPMPSDNHSLNHKNIVALSVIFGAVIVLFAATIILAANQQQNATTQAATPTSMHSYQNPFSAPTETVQPTTQAYENPFAKNETDEVSDEPYQNPFAPTP